MVGRMSPYAFRRYAVTIGINQYASADANLSGCVNDAMDWGALLSSRGYVTSTLLDTNATRDHILDVLEPVVGALRYRDRLVVTFSGHGTRLPDRNGDEADGWDEALVTHDLDVLTDDTLGVLFGARAHGSRVVLVSDSCHSGTVNRVGSFDGPHAATYDPDHLSRRRYLPPAYFSDRVDRRRRDDSWDYTAPRRSVVASTDALLLAGCADSEYSYDAWFRDPGSTDPNDWRPNGAFTHAAIEALYRPGAQPATMRDWLRAMNLPTAEYPQHPHLTGSAYQKRWPVID